MKLIHTVILFLAISSTFVCKKKKSKHTERPKGMGTDKSPASCIKRGVEFGVEPRLDGSGIEWMAAVCPGVLRPKKGGSKKKKKKHKRSLERRSLKDESLWETCGWGIEHGAVCQRCHEGEPHIGKGKRGYPKNDIVLNACAMRYGYKIMNWPHDLGPQQRQFLTWVKKKDTRHLPDRKLLDDICPGVFDGSGNGSNDSQYEACIWGWTMGSKCMALGPLSDLIVESAERGCSLRYKK